MIQLIKALKCKGKELKLPTYLPVVFRADAHYTIETKIRPIIPRITRGVLINSYNFLRDPKLSDDPATREILNSCFVFIDSGGFLIKGTEINSKGIKVFFDKLSVPYKKILNVQNKFANLGNNIDLLAPLKTKQDIMKFVKVNSYLIDVYLHCSKNFLFFPTIHAHNFKILRMICQKLKKCSGFDGVSVGGLVLLKNNWKKIFNRLLYVQSLFPNIPIHAFGIGNPALLPIVFSIGIGSVDSSSHIRYALESKYIHPSSFMVLKIDQLSEKLPCDCKICKSFNKSDIIAMRSMGKAFLSIHNIYAYQQLADLCRDRGEDVLDKLSKKNPMISKAQKIFTQVKKTRHSKNKD